MSICSIPTNVSGKTSEPRSFNKQWSTIEAEGAVALMGTSIRSSPITPRIMQSAGPGLRIIAKFTIGVDNVDVDAANELGIMVTHAPTESNWGGVAENGDLSRKGPLLHPEPASVR